MTRVDRGRPKETACGSVSPDVAQLECVRGRGHVGEHRGVLWFEGKPSDHIWSNPKPGKHRASARETTGAFGRFQMKPSHLVTGPKS